MKELELFEEVHARFDHHTIDRGRVVATFRDSEPLVLPESADESLKSLKPGQRVAIIRVSDDCVKVRRL